MLSIFNQVKRYIAGALVGLIVSALAAVGIAQLSPEAMDQLRILVDAVLMFVFYVATIVYKTWQQKKALERGETLPERIEHISKAGGQ